MQAEDALWPGFALSERSELRGSGPCIMRTRTVLEVSCEEDLTGNAFPLFIRTVMHYLFLFLYPVDLAHELQEQLR